MDLNTIRNELHALAQLADAWTRPDAIPAIERDLMLEKLRNLYEAVRFALPGIEAEPAAAVTDPAEEASPIDLGAVLSLDGLSDARAAEDAAEAAAEPVVASEAEPEPEPVVAAEPVAERPAAVEAATEPEELAESVAEPVEEPAVPVRPVVAVEPVVLPDIPVEPEPESEPIPERRAPQSPQSVEEPAAELEPKPKVEMEIVAEFESEDCEIEADTDPEPASRPVAEAPVILERPAASAYRIRATPEPEEPRSAPQPSQLGADREEEMHSRRKQRVILSLYDNPMSPDRSTDRDSVSDANDRPVEPRQALEPEPERPEAEVALAPKPADAVEPPVGAEPERVSVAEPERAEAPAGAVLGDVINHDVQTLGDTLVAPRSIASELHRNERVVDLRKAVGINDRFLLIRDLFDGDTEAYERAIGQLDAFEDFDACMIHIAENYAWNSDSDGARLLMDLLERKFA